MRNGEAHRVPAGGAMAVDREGYAEAVTAEIENNPLIEVIREEITEIPDDAITVIASGPLTSDALAEKIHGLTVEMGSISMMPLRIVDKATIDMNKVTLSHAMTRVKQLT
ncbi:MAG: FAD-dependent oxidoreductase [Streptococcus salivarius]